MDICIFPCQCHFHGAFYWHSKEPLTQLLHLTAFYVSGRNRHCSAPFLMHFKKHISDSLRANYNLRPEVDNFSQRKLNPLAGSWSFQIYIKSYIKSSGCFLLRSGALYELLSERCLDSDSVFRSGPAGRALHWPSLPALATASNEDRAGPARFLGGR